MKAPIRITAALACLLSTASLAQTPPAHDMAHLTASASIHGAHVHPDRVVEISMSDDMRFNPSKLYVFSGETIQFEIANHGKIPHEFVLGDMAELHAHAAMMRDMPEMEHDESNMVVVKPGSKAKLSWTFAKAGQLAFACLIPGHMESGMVGQIDVAPRLNHNTHTDSKTSAGSNPVNPTQ